MRKTDRQGRDTERKTDRQGIDTKIDRHIDRQIDRRTDSFQQLVLLQTNVSNKYNLKTKSQ